MGFEKEIFKDYGTIPEAIGEIFLKTNPVTWNYLCENVTLPRLELRNGLALLIQRRFIKYFLIENEIIYFLDTKILKKRIYFTFYLNYVKKFFLEEHYKYFKNVLINGTYKEMNESMICQDLLNKNILQYESLESSNINDQTNKRKKLANNYVIVNFEKLDYFIYHEKMYEYVCKVFNKAAGEVYKAILKVEKIDRYNILNNLESTKIILSNKGNLINNKSNIDEYLEYLYLSRILDKSTGMSNTYNLSYDKSVLKKYVINLLISKEEYRRIFNMIYDKIDLDDRSISLNALLSITKTSGIILKLQSVGLLIQKTVGNSKFNYKNENLWSVDLFFASNVLTNIIEKKIADLMIKYNNTWIQNYFKDNVHQNEISWISDIIGLSYDCLILNY